MKILIQRKLFVLSVAHKYAFNAEMNGMVQFLAKKIWTINLKGGLYHKVESHFVLFVEQRFRKMRDVII